MKKIPPEKCSICRQIADHEFVDHLYDPKASLPEAWKKLRFVRNLGYYYPKLYRCPECGRRYVYNLACGYMEHDEELTRLGDEECERMGKKGP